MHSIKFFFNGDVTYSVGGNKTPYIIMSKASNRYVIDNMARRLIISAAKKLAEYKLHKLILLTPTFPYDVTEKEASTIFTNFLDNLKKTYKLKDYVWTKERQGNGRLHYHLLGDIPFFSINRAQQTWNVCIKNVNPNAKCNNNSLRLPDRNKWSGVVNDTAKIAAYIAKYVSKATNNPNDWYKTRCYQISKGLFPLHVDLEYTEFLNLVRNNSNVVEKYKTKFGAGYFIKENKKPKRAKK